MAMQNAVASAGGIAALDPKVEARPMTRMPILDKRDRVHGYKLLFESGADASAPESRAAFAIERLARGLPAFVHCADPSTENWVRHLPAKATVLELAGDVAPTPELIAACRGLKASGFRLALADFSSFQDANPLLLDLADYFKLSLDRVDAGERRRLLDRMAGKRVLRIAGKVETQQDFKQAAEEGFDLFEGYYFSRPNQVPGRKIPGNRMVHLEMLEVLQRAPVDMERLSQLITCDAALTYRLLRLVNSPFCALRQEVTSIRSALLLLGEATARRIATLAIGGDFNSGQPAEILRMAFVRARFCELAGGPCGLIPSEQYLIGMVSMFPAMLGMSMKDLAQWLPLREGARAALLGDENAESALLRWLAGNESGSWARCQAIVQSGRLGSAQLSACFADAVAWADGVVDTAA